MRDTITNAEAIEMMTRCTTELLQLRATIDRLQPKADAYDNIAAVLRLLPQPGGYAAPDFIWTLKNRIAELTPKATDANPA